MKNLNSKKISLILLTIAVFTAGGGQLTKLPTPLFSDDYSTVVLADSGAYLRVFLNSNDQWIFPPQDKKIPAKLKQAVINFEDKRFYNHLGVDPLAVARAAVQDLKAGRIVSGASTITMQLARLAKEKERTVVNKLIEMIQALRLEAKYSKEEVLQLYLTHAPYGGNIIGYQAAALRYFGKEPDQLTWSQAALLAVLPNSPGLINPTKGRARLRQKRNRLLNKLQAKGLMTSTTCRLAKAEEIPDREQPFDLAAPHLARWVKQKYKQNIIRTTINKDLQQQMTNLVHNYMVKMKQRGVHNCAVLIADTKTGAVKTYIGSQNYFDQQHGGKIDGVQMKRSSGSILKPFLYALAMDDGLIIPESKVQDVPASYGAYTPYNANHKFQGVVTARKALVNSLNAPAVSLLDQYGIKRFYRFLNQAGVTTLFRKPEEYGLPLVLGGAEVKLWDIAALYRGLGNYGSFSDLTLLSQPKDKFMLKEDYSQQLITNGSAYLTLNIIDDLKRPGQPPLGRDYGAKWRIAWKTGTSYGNRDAWAVGVAPDWTIAVWLGNFDGQENKELSGLKAAAPLFFKLFTALPKDYYQTFFAEPRYGLETIKVSTETGYRIKEPIIDQGLVERKQARVSSSAQPLRFSPYEEIIYTNQAGTKEVCSRCWDRENLAKSLQVIYPPAVVEYMEARGSGVYNTLPHKESCPTVGAANPLEFIYPQPNSILSIPRGVNGEYQKVTFKVAHAQQDSKLFWYLDQKYLGTTTGKHHKLLSPTAGQHQLHVVDKQGHQRKIKFQVQHKR